VSFMQIVKTDKGYVSGTVIGEPGKEVSIFRGIPYAAPPVGDLRWKPPRPAAPWEGIRECTRFSAISPQTNMPGMSTPLFVSEDCLYLNVLTPARQPDEKLPVMVWMHGGGYSMGSGNDLIWNNYRLPQYGVVLVTLNHRLGPLGLCAHPALTKESPEGSSGGYLFLDLIASLEWIRDNIAAFGGDPDNVTIFGESGGGAKVTIMMTSPLAKGLFHRAIFESGTATVIFTTKSLAEMENLGEKLFEKLGIGPDGDPLEQARQLPFEKIIEAGQALETLTTTDPAPAPAWDATVDGWVIPDSPDSSLKADARYAVPTIVSANLGELTGPGSLVIPQLIPAYIDILESVNRAGVESYACIFDQVPSSWKSKGCVAIHGLELPYVFGDWDNSTGWWSSMLLKPAGAENSLPGLDKTDRIVSEAMMELWTSFARNGRPQAKGVPDWPAYSAANDSYLYLGDTMEVKAGFSKVA
jgi:para-nitrobenzyl esterase